MPVSSPTSPGRNDAIALVLEINQLLFQYTLQLQDNPDAFLGTPDGLDLVRKECFQRLSSNLSFLASCADPRNRARPTMPNLSAPQGVESVQEHYAKLATLFRHHTSPKQIPPSPVSYTSGTPLPSHTLAQARPSHSPNKRMVSPTSVMPAVAYNPSHQQTIQQHHQQRINVQPQVLNGMYRSPQITHAQVPQQMNPYMLEQMRAQQKISTYAGQHPVGMASSPSPHSQPHLQQQQQQQQLQQLQQLPQQHQPQHIPRAYAPSTAQQMAMAQARLLQHQPHQQNLQQQYQAQFYPNSGQGYPG